MKKKTERIYRTIGVFTTAAIVFSGCGTGQSRKEQDGKNLKIGISVYDQYDTFVSELVSNFQDYAKTREKDWGISITMDVENANKSQMIQNDQMDDFIKDGMDVVCINLVDRTDASTIIEKAQASDVPVIFFNRELVQEDLERWDKLYYVGADAFESGELQGDSLVEKCKKDFNRIDKNGDGVLQYIMQEGEAGHNDSMVRTMSVINEITGSGYLVEKLSDEIANWNRDQAANKMKQFLERFGNRIEVVLANNDDMALGAVDALEAAGYDPDSQDWPMVLGIDGTTVGLNAVNDGQVLGTVLKDAAGLADGLLVWARSITAGAKLAEE